MVRFLALSSATPCLILLILGEVFAQRNTADLLEYVIKVKSIGEDLRKYRKAFEYASGIADDISQNREPRRPKPFEFKKTDDRLGKIRRDLRQLRVPPSIDPKAPEYRTEELKKNDIAVWKKAAAKLIAYNRALRGQVSALGQAAAALNEVQERAKKTRKAAKVMADALEKIHNTPGVQALFRDMFGLAWFDIQATIMPLLVDIQTEAEARAKEFKDAHETRLRLLRNHTSLLQAGARVAGITLPSDIRD
jgi:hypothetical protein